MSKPRIFFAATGRGFKPVMARPVRLRECPDYLFFAYQDEKDGEVLGWHLCESTTGHAVILSACSYTEARYQGRDYFEKIPRDEFVRGVASLIKKGGAAPTAQEIKP